MGVAELINELAQATAEYELQKLRGNRSLQSWWAGRIREIRLQLDRLWA